MAKRLTAEDVLPNSAIYPRKMNSVLDVAGENNDKYLEKYLSRYNPKEKKILAASSPVTMSTFFRFNPIAMIVPEGKDYKFGGKGDAGNSNDRDDLDDSDDEDDDEDGVGENEKGKQDGENNAFSKFALHINYGNEDFSSFVRISLKVSKEILPAFEWVLGQLPSKESNREKISFSLAHLLEHNKDLSSSKSVVNMLNNLVELGYLVRQN